jgi:hypothetical protein
VSETYSHTNRVKKHAHRNTHSRTQKAHVEWPIHGGKNKTKQNEYTQYTIHTHIHTTNLQEYAEIHILGNKGDKTEPLLQESENGEHRLSVVQIGVWENTLCVHSDEIGIVE